MLVAIGYHVELTVKGRLIKPKGVLFYDFKGRDWPRSSLLIGNRPEGKPSRPGRAKWFGSGYQVMQTSAYEVVPGAKSTLLQLSNWRFVGPIARIRYDRGLEHPERATSKPLGEPTTAEPRGDYHHVFRKDEPPGLFQRGKFYRIVLLPGTVLNQRGFVEPGQ